MARSEQQRDDDQDDDQRTDPDGDVAAHAISPMTMPVQPATLEGVPSRLSREGE